MRERGASLPDVSSNASAATTGTFVALDVHKNAITAGVLPAEGGRVELVLLEHREQAIRRFLKRLGDPRRLAVCYEAGPCGYQLYRLLASLGVACDIVAPSLTPVRPGDRVKTDSWPVVPCRGCRTPSSRLCSSRPSRRSCRP